MRKLYPDAEDVPQRVASRAVRILERHLRQARVERARDLTEEARVRLYRELRAFLDSESGARTNESGRARGGAWGRLLKRLEDFLSFSDLEPSVYLPLALCPAVSYCEGMRYLPLLAARRALRTLQQRDAPTG